MNLSWFGLGCVRLQSKYGGIETTTLIEPFDEKTAGVKLPRRAHADIVVDPHRTGEGEGKFLIDHAGEFEVGGTFIWSIPLRGGGSTLIHKIQAEDMIIVHMGNLNRLPEDAELEAIENVDILLVPVGGNGVLSAAVAAELTTRIEPRIVIPIWFKAPGIKTTLDGPETFLKAMGSKAEPQPKLKLSKKDLPSDHTEVMLLNLDVA